jgi:glycosyltransferase involved in cell wall biosynthesis
VPSLCEEACSTTVLEALALGKPVLALARGGTPELASYQHYPGQLQLARSMAELAEGLHAALALPQGQPRPQALPERFGADAAVIVDRLVDLYAD